MVRERPIDATKAIFAGQLTVLHEWHRNGKAMVEAVYAKGLLVSQKRWDDNGTLLLTMGEVNPPLGPIRRSPW